MPTIIPFGPQHPVLPEPLHLKIVLRDEIVQEAVPTLGYVHRGLETLTEKRDMHQMVQIVERVCGICSCIHAANYCRCVEEMLGLEIPERAEFLRVAWSELHRMHSHLLWLGLMADAFGLESLFMQCWKIREKIMDVMEATAGNRVIISVNVLGGVRRDLSGDQKIWIKDVLKDVRLEMERIMDVFGNDPAVRQRMEGVGVLEPDQARELGAVGPTLRGSGIAQDVRQTGYGAYGRLDFEPVVESGGDSLSRTMVRFREVLQSIDLVNQALDRLPSGDLAVRVKGKPEGEIVGRTEQPRGELMYYLRGNGTKFLERVRIRTPTFANVPSLLAMLPGVTMADVPVVVLSIDPCISCTER